MLLRMRKPTDRLGRLPRKVRMIQSVLVIPWRMNDCALATTASRDPRRGLHHSTAQFSAPRTSIWAMYKSSSGRSWPSRARSLINRRQISPYLSSSKIWRLRIDSGTCPALRIEAVV